MPLRMTLLPHAARLHCKPMLLLQRKRPAKLDCKNEWVYARAPYVRLECKAMLLDQRTKEQVVIKPV